MISVQSTFALSLFKPIKNREMAKRILFILFILFQFSVVSAQHTSIEGHISTGGQRMPYVSVVIKSLDIGVTTDKDGKYHIELDPGEYKVEASFIGYKKSAKSIELKNRQHLHLDFNLIEDVFGLDQVVVTSTRSEISRKASPITVNVLTSRVFEITQASTIS